MMVTMNNDGQNGRSLPDGWELSTLGESCVVVLGQSPSSDTYNTEGVGLPFYQGKTEFGDLYPTPEKWCSLPKKLAEKDDILISVRAPVGPTNLCPEKSCIGRGLAALRPKNMPTKYFLHYLRYIEKEWDSKATGTTFKAITGDVLRNQEIPLAPLDEQERIVNRIEELLSDLDAGVAALERVRAGLKRYKASVLKAACEGKLFENKKIESGQLPEGWQWAKLESLLSESLANGRSTQTTIDGFPVLRLTALKNGKIDLRERKIGAWTKEQAQNFLVKNGDFFVSRGNGSLHLVGRGGLVEQEPDEVAYPDTLIRIRVSPNICDIKYLRTVWDSPLVRNQIETTARTTAGIYKINQKDLGNFIIPLPPLDEQRRIVAEVERRLSVVGEVESAVEVGLARSARLRQSVLRSAFEGKL
ncbi:MAG: restriction endonuclease subunit S [Chloroflexi bacterium]|nr:restriction endonuclease subunit S [Chloroflexota bacterium]